ncbi:MAG: peptidylprolyl isomerase [Planctomycetota bacterium]|nr:peptidylprolyl isomerase [Planctomycetota bacterium]
MTTRILTRFICVSCLVCSLGFTPGSSAFSQEPGEAEFNKQLEDWKKIITELQLLRQEYYLAQKYDESVDLRKKYEATKKSGDQKIREMKLAVAKAYREKPREGTVYYNFLINSLTFDLEKTEEQTTAYELAKALNSQPITRSDIARRVGMSLFIHNEYDEAQKLLKYAMARNEAGVEGFEFQLQLIPRLKPLWEKELKQREKDKKAKLPRAVFETTKGRFVIELYEDNAPNTVKNFVKLARQGFYNDLDFFYVLPFQFATSGSPNSRLTGSPGYVLPNEGNDPEKRRGNFRGTLCVPALGNDNTNLAGSMFMITFGPYSEANTSKYCNFGRIIEGMEIVDSLNRSEGLDGKAFENFTPDKITTVTVENLRDHNYEPEIIRLSN